jgi:hypothetical protein
MQREATAIAVHSVSGRRRYGMSFEGALSCVATPIRRFESTDCQTCWSHLLSGRWERVREPLPRGAPRDPTPRKAQYVGVPASQSADRSRECGRRSRRRDSILDGDAFFCAEIALLPAGGHEGCGSQGYRLSA